MLHSSPQYRAHTGQAVVLRSHLSSSRPSHSLHRASVATAAGHRYRQGTPQDVAFIKERLLLESMNPLGIRPENFTVVEDDNGAGVIAFAQLAPLPSPNTCEFRSLVVLPEHRGKDIGSQLLRHVVGGSSAAIYLTTLRKTIPFYEAAGFRLLQASEVPWFLWFEAAAGTVVAKVAANDQLVVMFRPATAPAAS